VRVDNVWRDGERVRLLVTQFPGNATDPRLVKKFAAAGTSIEEVDVDAYQALWLEGGPHAILFVTSDGTARDDLGWRAGNTLLVQADGVTVRVEADVERDDAVDVVRSLLR
jgi:hypothetical protein